MDADEPVTPVDAGGIRRMVARSSLQVRLAALSALLAAMVMIVTFSVLSVQVRQNTQQLFARELIHNGRTLVALQHESRRQLVLTASLIAESPTLHSAISTYRSEQLSASATADILTNTVQNEVRRLGAKHPAGILLVTAQPGPVLPRRVPGLSTTNPRPPLPP